MGRMTVWLTIIGVGDEGLAGLHPHNLAHVKAAPVFFGSRRLLKKADFPEAELHFWEDGYDATLVSLMARRGMPTVLIATGDPMHFGIGATLASKLAPEEFESLPAPSAFSLAASRLRWPLQETQCISLHGQSVGLLVRHIAPRARILALTSSGKTVAEAAALLSERGYGRSRLTVLEHMGGSGERIVEIPASEAASQAFADLNTLAVECEPFPEPLSFSATPGLPDSAFEHDGQLTKREVRAVTVSALQPFPGALLWDIGAGCGSVGIEWMRAARAAKAIAVEENAARLAMIKVNASSLGVPDLKIVEGAAPLALTSLPAPDSVFIGGGVTDAGVFETAFEALRPNGILVANAVTVQGEARLIELAGKHLGALSRIAVSRAEPVGGFTAFKPMMPVTMLTLRKERPA
jgi:precorrin-6B C5,15-methyltransferase / cobalt-precorrin-6B C5,C15-methyltransferase